MAKRTGKTTDKVTEGVTTQETPRGGQFTIINDIELPARSRESKYPFATMEVGQGFVIPDDRSSSTLYASARRANVKIAVRRSPDGSGVVVKVIEKLK